MPILFNGITDYIAGFTESNFDRSGGDLSVSVWFNTSKNYSGESGMIILKRDPPALSFWEVRVSTANKLQWTVKSDGSNYIQVSSSGTVNDGAWHHGVVVYKSSDHSWALYIDGSEVSVEDATPGTVGNYDNNTVPAIGINSGNLTGNPFDGLIDEIAVYTIALVQADVDRLYNPRMKRHPLQVQPSSLIMSLPMDDGAHGTSADGDTLFDMSGNGNNGVASGGIWQAEQVLSYAPQIIIPKMIIPAGIPLPKVNAGLVNAGLTGGLTG